MEAELRQQPKGLNARLQDSCVIGRSPEADIKVFSARVSREHVMIRRQASGYWLYDLDSANGTLVNDRPVSQPVQLHHGDIIQMADIVFEFFVPEEAGGAFAVQAPPQPTMIMDYEKASTILLVADIINYTGISGSIGEENLNRLLNAWYVDCQALIEDCGGTIDNFLGDGMFAYWKNTSHAWRAQAVKAAAFLAAGPRNLPEPLRQVLAEKGTRVRCGVGLHIGHATLGTLARGTRTAVGDDVNLAFRIEAKTRELAKPVLASAAFIQGWETAQSIFAPCGPQQLKGFPAPVELYALTGKT